MVGEISELTKVASSAILRLRERTLKSGQPFMINTNDLPKNQCYLEFPDHKIQLVSYDKTKNFIPIRTLSEDQSIELRRNLSI